MDRAAPFGGTEPGNIKSTHCITIADTAGICITKAMNRPLTGGTVEAAAKPWLIPAGK